MKTKRFHWLSHLMARLTGRSMPGTAKATAGAGSAPRSSSRPAHTPDLYPQAKPACQTCSLALMKGARSPAQRAHPRLSDYTPPPGRRAPKGMLSRRDALGWLIAGGGLALSASVSGIGIFGIARKLSHSASPPVPTANGVIGSTAQARNSATAFTNPHTGKTSLLVHLPSGAFVAYEQACTHKSVYVDYDPASHRLVCPAHGAIFDPAQGAKVLQGPATQALPQVRLYLNPNGTITTS